MAKYRKVTSESILAALYELDAIRGHKRFSWADLESIAHLVLKAQGRPQTRRVGNTLRRMQAEGIVEGWKVGKSSWWRVKKQQ